MKSVLYISQNGITDHIGQSQIAPYLVGLAKLNYKIHILSAEKWERASLLDRYISLFSDAGMHWTRVPYRKNPRLLGHAITYLHLYWKAKKITKDDKIRLVHCRSFPPAMIGLSLKRKFGVRLIFDFRDFYADGGILKTRGLENLVYRRMKRIEGSLIRGADKVVCLTEKAQRILSSWYFPVDSGSKHFFEVIPCCADFDHFSSKRVNEQAVVSTRIKLGISEKETVLLYLGSLGPDYLLFEMFSLFRQLLVVEPNSKFLFVANNGKELVESVCRSQQIDVSKIVHISVDRNEVPTLISLADLSVIFIRADLTKAGCSPTKLAELFALNIPVIVNSGVGDLDQLISVEHNGSAVVADFSDFSLSKAIRQVLDSKRNKQISIRENSLAYDLQSGIRKYARVYSELLEMI